MEDLRSILNDSPDIGPDPARVRFSGWDDSKLNVEIYSYINVRNFNKALEIRENLSLQILEAVTRSGTALAYPTQTLYMAGDADELRYPTP